MHPFPSTPAGMVSQHTPNELPLGAYPQGPVHIEGRAGKPARTERIRGGPHTPLEDNLLQQSTQNAQLKCQAPRMRLLQGTSGATSI